MTGSLVPILEQVLALLRQAQFAVETLAATGGHTTR